MKAKLTPWFSGNVKPARVGFYEVGHSRPLHHNNRLHLTGYPTRFWNGYNWITDDLFDKPSIFGKHETHQWRGLAQRPSKG